MSPLTRTSRWKLHAAFGFLVTAAIWLVYYQVHAHEYLNVDDDVYVLQNPYVRSGLSVANVRWAFTHAYQAYWLPLTWVSFMLDVELFGLRAGPELLINVGLHTLNVLLLYGILVAATDGRGAPGTRGLSNEPGAPAPALWLSAWVAAIFALHPLRMESVAWVSQRKDALSMLFWLLTTAAYIRYVRRPSIGRYTPVFVAFALGLLVKPTLVTLPLVLLLLDFWPLGRTAIPRRRLLFEKLPLFALAGAASLVTLATQSGAGAVPELDAVGLGERVANSAVGYLRYVGKLVYPVNLAVFYPLADIAADVAAGAAVAVIGTTVVAIRMRRARPYLFVGWFWYLVTLLPVIGLIQVGGQAIADRYTYIPSIGLTLAVAWGAAELARSSRAGRTALAITGVASVLACAIVTQRQLGYWRDSIALFARAVEVTDDNFFAHNNLGEALMRAGRTEEAGSHYARAVEIHPGYPEARNNYGRYLAEQGRYAEAEAQFRAALEIRPGFAVAESNVATARARMGDLDGAVVHYLRALEIDPLNPDTHFSYGDTLMLLGRPAEARLRYETALRLRPEWNDAKVALERARTAAGDA